MSTPVTTLQATVLTFDPQAQDGTVVTDAGAVLPFDQTAFRAGGLRLLRPGQRVVLGRSADGVVRALTIVTLPLPTGQSAPDRATP